MKITIGEGNGSEAGPLVGIRVLDVSAVVSGPLCGQILGDLGADVIKVESPAGDTTRRLGPPFRGGAGGLTGMYTQFNRNKRSLAVDLKTDEGRGVLRRLARGADVLIENYRPGVAERLGIGYETLSAENPALIYVAISGFGPDGPYADHPAYDTVIQGLGGFMRAQGDAQPELVRCIVADKITAFTATYAVLAALFSRDRQGGSARAGQRVDIPMLDSYVAFMLPDTAFHQETFQPKEPNLVYLNPHRTWTTKDGHVVMLIIEDHQFAAICRVLEREDMIDDPRCVNLITRIQHALELFGELDAEIRKWTTSELVERARKLGAPLAPCNGIQEMLDDPQIRHNRVILEVEHPEHGTVRYLRNPVRFASTPTSLREHAPRLGEQTDTILGEAGFTDDEIHALRESGTVC